MIKQCNSRGNGVARNTLVCSFYSETISLVKEGYQTMWVMGELVWPLGIIMSQSSAADVEISTYYEKTARIVDGEVS